MSIRRITAFFLILIVLICTVSCSQRKQSPPEQEGKSEQESDKGYIVYINTEPGDKRAMSQTDVSGKKKEKVYEKNTYSPVGYEEKIAFLSRELNMQGLYMINADGSGLTPVMNNTVVKDNSLSWSHDGSKLVFISKQALDKSDEVYYVEAGKYKAPVKITDDSSNDESPRFSSDGKMILYCKLTDNGYDIYRYNIADQSNVNITSSNANDISPAVSPDGTRILFLSDEKEKSKYNLYMMDMNGGNRTELTTGLNIVKDTVKISPDSSMVAFVSMDDRRNKTGHVIDLNKTTVMIADDAYIMAWSGDSKMLYYATFDPKYRKIMEFDVVAKEPKDVLKLEYKPGEESEGIKFLHFTDKLK